MTFSIVARDSATGDLGVAVQSKFLAVGAVVPWARAEIGAVATQAFANVAYGPDALAALAAGATAPEALDILLASDELREERQVGIVDAAGSAASHTGRHCFRWAGGRTGEGYAAQGNILAGPGVVDALAERFGAGELPFAELLVACLTEADAAGGDRRGRQSAALLVVRTGGGYGGGNDRQGGNGGGDQQVITNSGLRLGEQRDRVAELADGVQIAERGQAGEAQRVQLVPEQQRQVRITGADHTRLAVVEQRPFPDHLEQELVLGLVPASPRARRGDLGRLRAAAEIRELGLGDQDLRQRPAAFG